MVDIEGAEPYHELSNFAETFIAIDDDFDIAIDYDWLFEIHCLRFLIVIFTSNSCLQRSIEVEVVLSQILFDTMTVDQVEFVVSAFRENLPQRKSTSGIGTNRWIGCTSRDSRILMGGASMATLR
jgi:hypothetical protein